MLASYCENKFIYIYINLLKISTKSVPFPLNRFTKILIIIVLDALDNSEEIYICSKKKT